MRPDAVPRQGGLERRKVSGARPVRKRRTTIGAILAVVCSPATLLNAQRSVWDGVYADSQADAGAALYDEHCSRCHGDTFEAADAGPPLSGPEFRANWHGFTLKDLFERIRGMPAFKTPARDRVVNANILAFLLRINGFPS